MGPYNALRIQGSGGSAAVVARLRWMRVLVATLVVRQWSQRPDSTAEKAAKCKASSAVVAIGLMH